MKDKSNEKSEQDTIASQAATTHYGRIAKYYELGSYYGSGGQIQKSKREHLSLLKHPSKILYPGVGWGHEVVEAVNAGHEPTIVELDPTMFEAAQSTLSKAGVLDKVTCINGNILEFDSPEQFDVVVASYFLDVFSPEIMRKMFEHLTTQIKTGGLLCLSGYAPLHGSALHKIVQWINHCYANLFCKLVVNNAAHGIYNYADYFKEYGLEQFYQKDFPHFNTFGPRFHRMWAATKI